MVYFLCLRCRAYWAERAAPACAHGVKGDCVLRVIRQPAREGQDSLPCCSACGYRGPDPVKEVIYGADGPNAVIATTLFQELPKERRKILAFTDGRQEAAYFAWYLGRTYEDIFFRNLILRTASRLMSYSRQGLSLRDLAEELQAVIHNEGLTGAMATAVEARRMAWRAVLREFFTSERRISLEGTGSGWWDIPGRPGSVSPPSCWKIRGACTKTKPGTSCSCFWIPSGRSEPYNCQGIPERALAGKRLAPTRPSGCG